MKIFVTPSFFVPRKIQQKGPEKGGQDRNFRRLFEIVHHSFYPPPLLFHSLSPSINIRSNQPTLLLRSRKTPSAIILISPSPPPRPPPSWSANKRGKRGGGGRKGKSERKQTEAATGKKGRKNTGKGRKPILRKRGGERAIKKSPY